MELKCASCGGSVIYQSGIGSWPVRQAGNENHIELLVPFVCVECQAETSVVFHAHDKGGFEKLSISIEATNGREATVS